MNLKLIILSILLLSFSAINMAGEVSNTPKAPQVKTKQFDKRAKILAEYFTSYNSPFEYHAQTFVDAADKYGLDWKLVPAISGVESTFGKQSYGFNAWGWGIYGDNRLSFDSWTDGINTVSEGLKKGYVDKGLTDPYSMNRVYAASKSWGWRVDYFMKDIDRFKEKYELREE